MNPTDLARLIDHTNLRPDALSSDLDITCKEAIKYNFAAVVCYPIHLRHVAAALQGHSVKAVAVVDFPSGLNTTEAKITEAQLAVDDGAEELDVVANLDWLRGDQFVRVAEEIAAVRAAVDKAVGLKVIIETALLNESQLAGAVEACVSGGAQFVKSSTGLMGGATVPIIRQMSELAAGRIAVKASGGIKTCAACRAMIAAGAARIGTSASVAIIRELLEADDYTT